MSIRVLTLYFSVSVLIIYAWKDWFVSLCGLVLLMAIFEHEDMPRTMFGIPGLNPWNVLFLAIFLTWLVQKAREEQRWDMPRYISLLFFMYILVILVGVFRTALDLGNLREYTRTGLIIEGVFNTLKWIMPGVFIFYGCKTRRRLFLVIICLLGMYFLIGVQIARLLPPSSVFQAGGEIEETRSACSDIGYTAVDMSVFLAGAFWAILSTIPLLQRKIYKALLLIPAGIVLYSQALTGGRAGYIAWAATGLMLCFLKWRKILILVPIIVIILPLVFPGAIERMFLGFGETDVSGNKAIDDYKLTSGRADIWPYIIDKISESPFIGYGRFAMKRTGLDDQLMIELNEPFGHPHNMYLETLLDNGIIGSFPIFVFWIFTVVYSAKLFRSHNNIYSAVGGIALSLILVQLVAGFGSQHFYPEVSTLGMWIATFLSIRVYIEQKHMQESMVMDESFSNLQFLINQTDFNFVYSPKTLIN